MFICVLVHVCLCQSIFWFIYVLVHVFYSGSYTFLFICVLFWFIYVLVHMWMVYLSSCSYVILFICDLVLMCSVLVHICSCSNVDGLSEFLFICVLVHLCSCSSVLLSVGPVIRLYFCLLASVKP